MLHTLKNADVNDLATFENKSKFVLGNVSKAIKSNIVRAIISNLTVDVFKVVFFGEITT